MFYRKLSFIILTVLIGSLLFVKVKAHDPNIYFTEGSVALALGVYTSADGEMVKKWKALEKLEIQFAMLGVQWDDNEEDMAENAIALGNAVGLDALASAAALVTATANEIKDIADAHSLKVAMVNKAIEIEAQNVVVATAVTEQGRAHAHYKAHYDVHKTKQSQVERFVKRGATPSSVAIGNPAVSCKNPRCTTVYYASVYGLNNIVSLAQGGSSGGYKGHKVTCSTPHVYWVRYDFDGKGTGERELVPSPYTYWSCPPNTSNCPLRAYHKRKCPGVCGEYNVIAISRFASGYYSPHKVDCKEEIPRSLSSLYLFNECHGTYYSCAGVDTCTNASNHVDDDDDDDSTEQDTEGLQTEQTQTSTPSYHACGVHETSVSGDHSAAGCGVSGHYVCDGSDHSLQASCTTTNASGQYCTVSSFYACQSHTHVYPTLVPCRNRDCGQMVTNKWEHVVTCRNGHRYWSCMPHHHDYHTNRCTR